MIDDLLEAAEEIRQLARVGFRLLDERLLYFVVYAHVGELLDQGFNLVVLGDAALGFVGYLGPEVSVVH